MFIDSKTDKHERFNQSYEYYICKCIWIAPYFVLVEPESPGGNYKEREEEGGEERVLI